MLPCVRDGLSVLLMEVWCPCRRSSICRHVHRALKRNALLDLTTTVLATACQPRNYVMAYSRCSLRLIQQPAKTRKIPSLAISAKLEAEAVTNGTHILAVLDVP